ncbi:MAG TPA: hypothetical protein VET87_24310 [Rubrivivax sp.]|nr:hypothetical protein [Rubrivivax sp.]
MLLQGASGNGPVQGVRLHDGREQRTAAVVLSAEPLGAAPTVFAPGALPPTWAQRLRSLPSSASMLAVHLGFRGELHGLASVNHLHVDGRMLEVVLPSLADPPARRRGIARWS